MRRRSSARRCCCRSVSGRRLSIPISAARFSPTSAPVRLRMKACRISGVNSKSSSRSRDVGLGLNRHGNEEILRILIVAAEPVRVRDLPHAFEGAHAIEIGDRQRLREIDLVDDDQPVGLGHVLAGIEGAFERGENAEDREGDQDRYDHQDRAQLLAEQILADEHEIVHAARSFSTKRPLSRCSVRRAKRAAAGSWVTITMVLPRSRLSNLQRRQDLVRRGAVEVAGRLVAQQQPRIGYDGAGDGDALLLTARHLTRIVLGPVGEADDLERRLDMRRAVAPCRAW